MRRQARRRPRVGGEEAEEGGVARRGRGRAPGSEPRPGSEERPGSGSGPSAGAGLGKREWGFGGKRRDEAGRVRILG